jgi:poly(3-hydroxyalkanoate) synthetase
MANTQSMCTSFMGELLTATHNFGVAPTRGTSATDTFKAALYLVSATINAATTVYSATGEVSGTGYSAGGVTVTAATAPTATNSSATAGVAFFTPSASITYTSVTLATAFDSVLIYNSTQSNKSVAVYTFGSQTITAGTFTLTMPSNTTTTALLRLATT